MADILELGNLAINNFGNGITTFSTLGPLPPSEGKRGNKIECQLFFGIVIPIMIKGRVGRKLLAA